MPNFAGLPKYIIDILSEVKNSEQVKSALELMQNYMTPDNQLQVVKHLVNVPPKDLTLDHMALHSLGDRMYMTYPHGLKGDLAPQGDRLGALNDWKAQLEQQSNGHFQNDDNFGDWLSDGGSQNRGAQRIFTGNAVTDHLNNLAIQLPHPLDIFKTSARSPQDYVQKPWHSTTINPNAYPMQEGTEAGFRVPSATPLVFNQGLADTDEVLAPLNDLTKYQFKKNGGSVNA
jgi:hypothetical protein